MRPICDQPLPADKLEQVKDRLAAREREQAEDVSARLRAEYEREAQVAAAQARRTLDEVKGAAAAALEQAQREAAAREATVREKASREAERRVATKVAEVEQQHAVAAAGLESRLAQLQAERVGAEQAAAAAKALLEEELANVRVEAAAQVQRVQAEAAQAEERIRREATEAAFATTEARVTEAVEAGQRTIANERASHEAARRADQALLEDLQARLAQSQEAAQTVFAEERRRHEASEAAAQAALTEAQSKLTEIEAGRRSLEEQLTALKASHDAEIAKVVQETREALEKANGDALGELRKKNFEETQNLITKLNDLQRQLDNKTAQELGEGAELDLFEQLKAAFPDDLVTRVAKGVAGPDVVHVIRENGQVCGKIVYDCKNRKDWKNEYASKLRADQIAAHADHAVLSTNKFPAGVRQLHQQDGVLLACPARVLVIAEMLRDLIVQMHQLRMSSAQREEKTVQLYAFVTGERFAHLFGSFDTEITKLEEIEEAEVKQHTTIWEKRGKTIKRMQKAQGDMRYEISRILGTAGQVSAGG